MVSKDAIEINDFVSKDSIEISESVSKYAIITSQGIQKVNEFASNRSTNSWANICWRGTFDEAMHLLWSLKTQQVMSVSLLLFLALCRMSRDVYGVNQTAASRYRGRFTRTATSGPCAHCENYIGKITETKVNYTPTTDIIVKNALSAARHNDSVQQRSVCKWSYNTDHDENRCPKDLVVAICPKKVTINGTLNTCQQVFYPIAVRFRNSTSELWEWKWLRLVVACTLANHVS